MALIDLQLGHQLPEVRLLCQNNFEELAVVGAEVIGSGDGLTKLTKKLNTNIDLANTQFTKNVPTIPLGTPIWGIRELMNAAFPIWGTP